MCIWSKRGALHLERGPKKAPAACQAPPLRQMLEARVHSPLRDRVEDWRVELVDHPDQVFAGLIVQGLHYGFRVGFRNEVGLRCAGRGNLPSVRDHEEVVQAYLDKECSLGRVLALSGVAGSLASVHTSPIGVIPKKTVRKWRLIVDLSSPRGHSVNDGIDEELASLAYVSIDNVTETISALGSGTVLGKCDVKEAYRLIPIHVEDWGLLGMYWRGRLYVDMVLPFGLRPAPKIFSAVADAFQWVICKKGVDFVFHYVDDFIVLGRSWEECKEALEILEETASSLGIGMEPSKWEGPARAHLFGD